MKRHSSILFLFLSAVFLFMAETAVAATSVSWISPDDGDSFQSGTSVNPTGQASASGSTGGTGLDLALVIDESGSMSGSGMTAAKNAAIALVEALPQDTTSVAVIGFDTTDHTYKTLTPLNPDKAAVIAAINSIGTGGGTNIAAGINAGTTTLTGGHTAGRAMMQVVLSDGDPYYGDESAAALAAAAAGITVHSVGIPGHNAAVMQNIATKGNGTYTNADNLDDLVNLFNGTGGNLVGIDYVDIELPDGTWIRDIAVDGVGNFTLPDWVMALGINTFTAHAYDTDGNEATAVLNLNGTGTGNAPVPEPATFFLFGLGLMALTGMGRKKG